MTAGLCRRPRRETDGRYRRVDREQRLWMKVDRSDPSGCWPWRGTITSKGYGVFQDGGRGSRQLPAHRTVYEALVGPIPPGLVIDHLCRVRSCVNPDHMEPVTNSENLRRQVVRHPTHCPSGHAYTADNLVQQRGRRCKRCHREQEAARRAALVAA